MNPNLRYFYRCLNISAFLFIFSLQRWFSGFGVSAAVVMLNESNFNSIVATADVAFVNFYADWCRFSHMLKPVWDETAEKLAGNENVIVASVNCDDQPSLSASYHINKYPTLKVFRFGRLAKREYRGNRNVDALYSYAIEQAKNVVHVVKDDDELRNRMDLKKRNIIAHADAQLDPIWRFYRSIASHLREDCEFYFVTGNDPALTAGSFQKLSFASNENVEGESVYAGNLNDYEAIEKWITEHCIATVRELTFENAEDLTEEGLPFMVLFKLPDDKHSLHQFIEAVKEMPDQRNAINFLYADGIKFAHPLHHLGKGQKDLPLVAIDSFRHMYLFPDFNELRTPGKLRQFVDDLHSGKLHQEYHHGPMETTSVKEQQQQPGEYPATDTQPHEHAPAQDIFGLPPQPKTSPPLSVFQKLKPSRTRYTFKDEL